MNELVAIAVKAAIKAGEAIMIVYNREDFNVEIKGDNSPLTQADKDSHDVIMSFLSETGIPVLSEEDEAPIPFDNRKKWTRCWIVDPLDGTKEFIKRNGEFTVNIAYAENGKTVFGVIYTPAKDALHYSIPGNGGFYLCPVSNNSDFVAIQKTAKPLPLQPLPSVFTIVGSRSHSSPETEAYIAEKQKECGTIDFAASGSSLKFCLLAEGRAHVYPRFAPTMEWDTAAGQAILEAAGGSVVVWPENTPLLYNRSELRNPWFLAKAKTD